MSGLWGHLVGVLILVMMTVFIGIWFWAWRPRHRRVFDALAEIPMLDGRAPGDDIPAREGRAADDGDEEDEGDEGAEGADQSALPVDRGLRS